MIKFVLLIVLFLIMCSAKRKPGNKPMKPAKKPVWKKACKGSDGKLYKKGRSITNNCEKLKCVCKRRKCYWQSSLQPNNCCKYKNEIVPNGWINVEEKIIIFCLNGKIEEKDLVSSPSMNSTLSIDDYVEDPLYQIMKLEKICVMTNSINKSSKYLIQFLGEEYKEAIIKEIDRIISRHKDEDFFCGIEAMLNLVHNTNLKKAIISACRDIGYSFLENEETVSNKPQNSETDTKQQRVVQGIPATLGQFPWQARFLFQTCKYRAFCGGVLISPCYVLTARHCADEYETNVETDFKVILGDISTVGVQWHEQHRMVHFVHYNPQSSYIGNGGIRYDVALLLLNQAPTTSDLISPIRLSSTYPGLGERATVSGWGRTVSNAPGSISTSLRWREIDLPTFWWCHQYIQNRIGSYFVSLMHDELCAGDLTTTNYAGSCHGDSGGPLVRHNPDDGIWELIGIVERGVPGCPQQFDHGIYTSTVYIVIKNWLERILDKASNPGSGGNCRCNARAIKHDNAFQAAWWDGANCWMEPAPPGCGIGGFADQAGRQFVYQNRFYIKPHKAIDCSGLGWFDTCHCYVGSVPGGGSVTGWCPNPSWGAGNIFNPGGPTIPPETCAFHWSGNRYTTPQGTGSPGHCLKGRWQGGSCVYYSLMPEDTKAFLWPPNPATTRNYYYGYPAQTYTCPQPQPQACFPPTSTVTLKDSSIKKIEDLVIGDEVLAMKRNEKPSFSKFLGWLHKDNDMTSIYLEIRTTHRNITISPKHLILRRANENKLKSRYVMAQEIVPGDFLLTKSKKDDVFQWENVKLVLHLFENGVFAPLTDAGTIVVDNIVVSCYAEVTDHNLAHNAFAIARIMPSILDDEQSQYDPGLRGLTQILLALTPLTPLAVIIGLNNPDLGTSQLGTAALNQGEIIFISLIYFIITNKKKKI